MLVAVGIATTASGQRICTLERGRPPVCTGGEEGSRVDWNNCASSYNAPNKRWNLSGSGIICLNGTVNQVTGYISYTTILMGGRTDSCESIACTGNSMGTRSSFVAGAVSSEASGTSVSSVGRPATAQFSSAAMRAAVAAARPASAPAGGSSASTPASPAPGMFVGAAVPAAAVSGGAWMPGYMSAMVGAAPIRRSVTVSPGPLSCSLGSEMQRLNFTVNGAVRASTHTLMVGMSSYSGGQGSTGSTPFNYSGWFDVDLATLRPSAGVGANGDWGSTPYPAQVYPVTMSARDASSIGIALTSVARCPATCASVSIDYTRWVNDETTRVLRAQTPRPDAAGTMTREEANRIARSTGNGHFRGQCMEAQRGACEWRQVHPGAGSPPPVDDPSAPHACL